MDFPIYLSVTQVRANIFKVASYLKRVQQLYAELEVLSGIEIESEPEDQELDLISAKLSQSFHKKMYLFHKHWEELIHSGAIVQDVEDGVVDFYSKFEEREIFICWCSQEPNNLYWHEIDQCHEEKQPISVLGRGGLV